MKIRRAIIRRLPKFMQRAAVYVLFFRLYVRLSRRERAQQLFLEDWRQRRAPDILGIEWIGSPPVVRTAGIDEDGQQCHLLLLRWRYGRGQSFGYGLSISSQRAEAAYRQASGWSNGLRIVILSDTQLQTLKGDYEVARALKRLDEQVIVRLRSGEFDVALDEQQLVIPEVYGTLRRTTYDPDLQWQMIRSLESEGARAAASSRAKVQRLVAEARGRSKIHETTPRRIR